VRGSRAGSRNTSKLARVAQGAGDLNLDELEARAAPFRDTVRNLEIALENYPLAMQSVNAYRNHVAEQRDFLKWVAAFASAGLLVLINAFRTQPVAVSSEIGVVIAELAFLLSVTGAGMYWWRVDLGVGRYLESSQHRVGAEITDLRDIILQTAELNTALSVKDVGRANSAYLRAAARSDDASARGRLEHPRFYDNEPVSIFWKGLCLGGYVVGILALLGDQLVKTRP
jgi:hypothetical protein